MMRRQQQQQSRYQDQQSRVLYEISALVLSLLRPPTPIPLADQSPAPSRRSPTLASSTTNPISPAGFAWLMLGISVSLMLCGSLTFFIGFMLMPWVIGLVMVFYVVGIVSAVSMLGRSILSSVKAPLSPSKEIPAWKLM